MIEEFKAMTILHICRHLLNCSTFLQIILGHTCQFGQAKEKTFLKTNSHVLKTTTIKLINNRWAWGRCLERWWGLEHRSRARRVTMTTLWAATTRHRHTDKRQWNHDTYHILTGKRGREGRGVKSPSTVEKAKVHVQMSWPQNPSCKTTRPPADPPPLRMTETRETPDQHCFAFNLA